MSNKVTLTPEELQKFQDLRKGIFETVSILGDLNYRKTLIDIELESLKETIKQGATQERTLLKEFGQKYGDGSINIETGEITTL
jgi:hypothetical protein